MRIACITRDEYDICHYGAFSMKHKRHIDVLKWLVLSRGAYLYHVYATM